ncbi:proline iminopeptidase-family hydrolase [Alicyclobacillus suci]|uniref:proline iminopeptidase-family hydrolase n=1 Tax=Alicyclobacillus suci TaxID=2816080 RepID=UPI0011BF37D6|nr:proline iminopeptidase-family hydrolase [Alicyclobacillus suci]
MHKEGFVEVEGGRVWYQINGRESGVPLVGLHGGPGGSSVGMERLLALSDDRPVVLYDQLGSGKSDRPSDASLWRVDRFVRELATLRSALGLEQVHLLGHSWGTMLLADYLLTQPTGVVSAIFSSPCLSAPRWVADADRLRLDLPADVQQVLTECEATGNTKSQAYKQATEVYMKKHVCRVEISPEERARRDAAFGEEVYNAMWGPSEFHATGTLKTYDRTDRLHEITVPALFTCGRYDEASPESTKYYQSLVPGAKYHVFEESSHSAMREQPEEYLRVIRNFVARVERTNA